MAVIANKYMLGPRIGNFPTNGDHLYLATRVVNGRPSSSSAARFAIQLVRKDRFSENAISLLRKDIPKLKQLEHRNVAKIVDVCEDTHDLYFVMEYCEGGDLFSNLVKRDTYSEEEARRLIRSLAEAIAYCHSQGIVIRGLTLSNIFLDGHSEDSTVKLINVGIPLPKMLDSQSTWAYVAPEYLRKESYSMAEDMWAFGVLAYELLCGYPPFKGRTEADVFRQIKGSTFTFNPLDWEDINDDAKDLIRNLLRLDPSKRLSAPSVLEHSWMTAELKPTRRSFALRNLTSATQKQSSSSSLDSKVKRKASSSSLEGSKSIPTKSKTKSKIKKPLPVHPFDLDLVRVALLPVVGSLLVALGMFHLTPPPEGGKGHVSTFDVIFGSTILLYLVMLHASRCITLGVHYLGEILWGCNIALLLAGVGIATNRPLMVGTAVCVVAVDQICWYIDVLGYLVTGKFVVGVAKYMKAPTTTWVHFLTGTHHLWFIPIAIAWLGPHSGIPAASYWGSVLVTTTIASMARLMTPYAVFHGMDQESVHVWNINLCYEFYEDIAIPPLHILDHKPPYVFLPFLVVVCNFVLNVVPVAVVIALSRVPFGGQWFLHSDWDPRLFPLVTYFSS